jgi:hypothetical protein
MFFRADFTKVSGLGIAMFGVGDFAICVATIKGKT